MSNVSDTRIRSGTQFWADKVKELTKKINGKKQEIASLNKEIMSSNNKIADASFQNLAKQRQSVITQEDKLKNKLSGSKSSGEQGKLDQQLNQLKTKRMQVSNKLKETARSKGLDSELAKNMRKERTIMNINKHMDALVKQRDKARAKHSHWKSVSNSRRRAQIAKHNAPIIANRIKASEHTHTKIYRTDMQDPTVFDLVETSPTETDTNNIATKPIDGSTAQSNFIARDSAEYEATFYLKGNDFNDVSAQYQKLADWSYQYEFTVNGFSNWTHAFISSIAKSVDNTVNHNGLIVSITFDLAKQAKIKYKAKQRPSVHHKAGTKKTRGRKQRSKRYVRVKSGMTYWSIANRFGVPLSKLTKMNRWPASRLPVGVKVRYR